MVVQLLAHAANHATGLRFMRKSYLTTVFPGDWSIQQRVSFLGLFSCFIVPVLMSNYVLLIEQAKVHLNQLICKHVAMLP